MSDTTISVVELRAVLNRLAKAPTTVGDEMEFHSVLLRLISLANQSNPIGAVVPVEAKETAPSGEALQGA